LYKYSGLEPAEKRGGIRIHNLKVVVIQKRLEDYIRLRLWGMHPTSDAQNPFCH